jgi:hypothetical protein
VLIQHVVKAATSAGLFLLPSTTAESDNRSADQLPEHLSVKDTRRNPGNKNLVHLIQIIAAIVTMVAPHYSVVKG